MQNTRTFIGAAHNAVHRHRSRLILIIITLLLLVLAVLEANAQQAANTPGADRVVTPASFRSEKPLGPVLVQGGEVADPIENAVEEYRRTGNARTIRQSSFIAYPFGHSQPTLTCAPLRACVVELEAEEILMAVIAGDTERWLIDQAFTGLDGATPLVIVKPTDHDLTTNLVISTDRRIYELTLDSPPLAKKKGEEQNPQALYTRRIRFYYPDDMVRKIAYREASLRQAADAVLPMGTEFRLENLNFNYRWDRSGSFPFDLEQVFDDGAHTYIKLPKQARNDVAPILFILDNGERQLLNYAVRAAGEEHQYYITDRVFKHGVLVVGAQNRNWLGKTKHSEQTMKILNLDRD